MFEAFRLPLSWAELTKRTVRGFFDHDGLSLAAELAYFFLLALFPVLLFLLSLASFFPLLKATEAVIDHLSAVAPSAVVEIVAGQMLRISEARHGGLLTLGFIGALWSGSSAFTSTFGTLNALYGLIERRSWWRVRLIAVALTIAFGLLTVLGSVFVVAGPAWAKRLSGIVGLGFLFHDTWTVVQWPLVFVLVTLAVAIVFHFGPDADQRWVWWTPGAVTATVGWLVASVAMRAIWASLFRSYAATYGTIGGLMVLMIWLYVSAIALLVGAEMNAAIEFAAAPEARRVRGLPVDPALRSGLWHHDARRRLTRPGAADPRSTRP